MRLKEERRINEDEKCVGRGEGKKRGGVCYGGMVWLRSLRLLFKGVDCVCDMDNVAKYRSVLS